MRHGSLFSGIGGFDLAAECMGWENIFHCEWNPFGQKVLKHYWPKAISYNDITKTDFTIHRGQIDILTGGFPCQPYSMAGKRKGKEDDRHLWPEMLRAIREIQPTWVVGENVFGLINWSGGLVFHEVQADLETEGYEVFPYVLPAVSVNAPHRRDRVWFVAYSNSAGLQKARAEQQTAGIEQHGKLDENVANTNSNGQHGSNGEYEIKPGEGGEYALNDAEQVCDDAVTGGKVMENKWHEQRCLGKENIGSTAARYKHGNISNNWRNWPTQSPLCSRDDGLSSQLDNITVPKWRNESIKAYGNAVVPQVVYQIFKTIHDYRTSHND